MFDEFRQALRFIRHRPTFSFLLILLLALCIGGNTAVFSAVSTVLLQPLPFKDVDRLVLIMGEVAPDDNLESVGWQDVEDWRRRSTAFSEMAPFFHWDDRILIKRDSSHLLRVNYVTPAYFDLLGVKPAMGRTFTAAEDVITGCCRVALISHDIWQRHFARDPEILGTKIQLNSSVYTVIGVMPQNFKDFPVGVPSLDLWLPSAMATEPRPTIFTERVLRSWYVLARLKPGVTLEQARRQMDAIGAQLQQEFPETNKDFGVHVHDFRELAFREIGRSVPILLAGALLVLLIGCANIANLLLVRAIERRKEMALRLAIGAKRGQLVRQIILESLILAALGGLLGLLFAYWSTALLAGAMPLPAFVELRVDNSALVFFLAITLLTGLAFSLPAAIGASRTSLRDVLQEGTRAAGSRHQWGHNTLVVSQIAVVAILLVGAGLLLKSFQRLRTAELDYNKERLLTLRLDFGVEKYEDLTKIPPTTLQMIERVSDLRGVESAVIWGPGAPGIDFRYIEVMREEAAPDELPTRTDVHLVSPGGLRLLGIPLLRGRDFTPADTADSQPVTMISESLAKVLWPGQEALGKRLRRRPTDPWFMVVGIMADANLRGRFGEREHDLMFVHTQQPNRNVVLLVRTKGDPASLGEELRQLLQEVEPQVPLYEIATMDELLRAEEGTHRFNAGLVSTYAALALILALLGIYAVLSQTVLQRTREIGVRVALGARQLDVLSSILVRGVWLVALGLGLGIAGALATTRVLTSMLYNITPNDPLTFVWVSVICFTIGLVAALVPALRATRIQPTTALRFE